MPTILNREPREVDDRLLTLGTTKEELLEIVRRSVAARNDATEDDPITAPGTLAYVYGVRAIRQIFRPKGWKRVRVDNIEGTVDPDGRTKILFQNADSAAIIGRSPQAISGKGPAAARAVDSGQRFLFEDMEEEREQATKAESATVWCLFVSVDEEGGVTAEFSCPAAIEAGKFTDFHERIFLIEPGEWGDIVFRNEEPEGGQDIEINVTRK